MPRFFVAICCTLAAVVTAQLSAPTIKSVTPTWSSHTGGATLTIRGVALGDGFNIPHEAFVGGIPCDIVDFKSGPSQIVCVTRSAGGTSDTGWRDVTVVAGGAQSSCDGSCKHRQHYYYSVQLNDVSNVQSRADGTIGHRIYNRYRTTDKPHELSITYDGARCAFETSAGVPLGPDDDLVSTSSSYVWTYCRKDPELMAAGFYDAHINALDDGGIRLAGNHYNSGGSYAFGPGDKLHTHESYAVVTSVSPKRFSRAGGVNITIKGVGFARYEGAGVVGAASIDTVGAALLANNNSVRVGGAPCRVVKATAREIVCTVQAQSAADVSALIGNGNTASTDSSSTGLEHPAVSTLGGVWLPEAAWTRSAKMSDEAVSSAELIAAIAAVRTMEVPTAQEVTAVTSLLIAKAITEAGPNRTAPPAGSNATIPAWNASAVSESVSAAAKAARAANTAARELTAQLLVNATRSVATAKRVVPGPWGARYERFDETGTSSLLSTLYASDAWKKGLPSAVSLRRTMDAPWNIGDAYGTVISSIFYPDMDGPYGFFPRGDDETDLYVTPPQPANSTSFSSEGMYRLARRNNIGRMNLRRGQAVYMQLRHKEGRGGDYASMRMYRYNTSHNANIAGGVDEIQDITATADVTHETHEIVMPDIGAIATERGGKRASSSIATASDFALRSAGSMTLTLSTNSSTGVPVGITTSPISLSGLSNSYAEAASTMGIRMAAALDDAYSVPCTYSLPAGVSAEETTSFSTQSFETSSDDWSNRNSFTPFRRRLPYCGKSSLWMERGFGRMFERGGRSFSVKDQPFMCMAYRIPATTTANMLILVNGSTWRSIGMTAPVTGSYPAVADWGVTADGFWHYGCINLLEQLTSSYDLRRARASTIDAVIWHPAGSSSQIQGEFEIDEFHIGSHPRFVQRDAARATFFDARIADAAARKRPVFTISSFTAATTPAAPATVDPADVAGSAVAAASAGRIQAGSAFLAALPGTAPVAAGITGTVPAMRIPVQIRAASCDRDTFLTLSAAFDSSAVIEELKQSPQSSGVIIGPANGTKSVSFAGSEVTMSASTSVRGSAQLQGQFEISFSGSAPRLVDARSSANTLRGHILALGNTGSNIGVSSLSSTCSNRRWRVTFHSLPGELPLLQATNRGNRLRGNSASVGVTRIRSGYTLHNEVPSFLIRAAMPEADAVEVTVNGVGSWCEGGALDASCGAQFSNDATPVLHSISPSTGRAGDRITLSGQRLNVVALDGSAVNSTVAATGAAGMLVTVSGLSCEPVYADCTSTSIVCVLTQHRSSDASAVAAQRSGGIGLVIGSKGAAVVSASAAQSNALRFTPEIAVDSASTMGPFAIGGGAHVDLRGAGLAASRVMSNGATSWAHPVVSLALYAPGANPAAVGVMPIHELNATVVIASYDSVTVRMPPIVLPASSSLAAAMRGSINVSAIAPRSVSGNMTTIPANATIPVAIRVSRPGAAGAAAASILWTPTSLIPGGEGFVTRARLDDVLEAVTNRVNAEAEASGGVLLPAGEPLALGGEESIAARAQAEFLLMEPSMASPTATGSAPAPLAVARSPALRVDASSRFTPRVFGVSPAQGTASGNVELSVSGSGFTAHGCMPKVWLVAVDETGMLASLNASTSASMASSRAACRIKSANDSAVTCVTPPTPQHKDFVIAIECPARGLSVAGSASATTLHVVGASAAAHAIAGYTARLVVTSVSRPIDRNTGAEVAASHPSVLTGVSATGGSLFRVSGLGLVGGGGAANVTAMARGYPLVPPASVAPNVLPGPTMWLPVAIESATDTVVDASLPSMIAAVPTRVQVADALFAQSFMTFDGSDVQSLASITTTDGAPVLGVIRARGASGQASNALAFPWLPRLGAVSASIAAVIPGRMGSSPVRNNEAIRVQSPSWRGQTPPSQALLNATQMSDLSPPTALPAAAGLTVGHSTLLNLPDFTSHIRIRLDTGVAEAAKESNGIDVVLSTNFAVDPAVSTRARQTAGYAIGINRCGRWEARIALQGNTEATGGDALARSAPGTAFPGCSVAHSVYANWARRTEGFAVAVGPMASADEQRWVSISAAVAGTSRSAVLSLFRDGKVVGTSNSTAVAPAGASASSAVTEAAFFAPLSFCTAVGGADVPYACSLFYGIIPDSPGAAVAAAASASSPSSAFPSVVGAEIDETATFGYQLSAEQIAYLHESVAATVEVELRVGANVAEWGSVWAPCSAAVPSGSRAGSGCTALVSAGSEAVTAVAWASPAKALATEQIALGLRPPQPSQGVALSSSYTAQSFTAKAAGQTCGSFQIQAPSASALPVSMWAGAGWTAVCRLDALAAIGSSDVTVVHSVLGDSVPWAGANAWRTMQSAPGASPSIAVMPRVTAIAPHQLSAAGGALITLTGEAFAADPKKLNVTVTLMQSSGYGPQTSGSWNEETVACMIIRATPTSISCVLARPGAAVFAQDQASWVATGKVTLAVLTPSGERTVAADGCSASGSSASAAGTATCSVQFSIASTPMLLGKALAGLAGPGVNMDLTGSGLPTQGEFDAAVATGITDASGNALMVPRVELVPLTPGIPTRICGFKWGSVDGVSLTCELPGGINGAMAIRVVGTRGLAVAASAGIPLPSSPASAWEPAASSAAGSTGAPGIPTVPSTMSVEYFTSLIGPIGLSRAMPLGGGGVLRVQGTGLGGGVEADRVRLSGIVCPVDPAASNTTVLECRRPAMPPLAMPPHARRPRSVAAGVTLVSPAQGSSFGASRIRPIADSPAASDAWRRMGSWSFPTVTGAAGSITLGSNSKSFVMPSRCNTSAIMPHDSAKTPSLALVKDESGIMTAWTHYTVSARVSFANAPGSSAIGLAMLSRNTSSSLYGVVWQTPAASGVGGSGCIQIVSVAGAAGTAPVRVIASVPINGLSPGTAANSISATVSGNRVAMSVNGVRVLSAAVPKSVMNTLLVRESGRASITAGVAAAGAPGSSATDVAVTFHGGASAHALPAQGLVRMTYRFGEGGDEYVFDHPMPVAAPVANTSSSSNSTSSSTPAVPAAPAPVRWSAEGSPAVHAVYTPAWFDDGARIGIAGAGILSAINASTIAAPGVIITVGGSPCVEPRAEGVSSLAVPVAAAESDRRNGEQAQLASTPAAISAMLADSLSGRPTHGLELVSCIAPPLPAGRHRVRVWTMNGFVRASAPRTAPEAATIDRLPSSSDGSTVLRTLDAAAVAVSLWVEAIPRAELGSPAGGRAVVVAGWGLPAQEDASIGGGVDVGISVCGIPCVPLTPEAAVSLTGVNATRAAAGLLPGLPVSTARGPMSVHRALVCEMRGLRPLDRAPSSSHAVRIPLDATAASSADVSQWMTREYVRTDETMLEIAPDTAIAFRFDPSRAVDADSALGSPAGKPGAAATLDQSGAPAVKQAARVAAAIPRGAIIEEARLELFTASAGGTSFDLDLVITATAASGFTDLSRPRALEEMWNASVATQGSVPDWRIRPFLSSGTIVASTDISQLLQSIVDSAAWPASPASKAAVHLGERSIAGAYNPPVINLLVKASRGNGTDPDDIAVAGLKASGSAEPDYDFALDDDVMFPNGGISNDDELEELENALPARPLRRVYSGDAKVDANGDGTIEDGEVAPMLFVRYRLPNNADAVSGWPAGDGTSGAAQTITGAACPVELTSMRSPAEEDAAQTDTRPQPGSPVAAFAEERHRRLSLTHELDPNARGASPAVTAMVTSILRDVSRRGEAPARTCRSLGPSNWVSLAKTAAVSASSTNADSNAATIAQRAEQAVDGKSPTFWRSRTAGANVHAAQWFQLDFETAVAVADIEIEWLITPTSWRLVASVDSQYVADRSALDQADTPEAAGNASLSWVEVASSVGLPSEGTAVVIPSITSDYLNGLGAGIVTRRLRLELLGSSEGTWRRFGIRRIEVRGCALRPVTTSSLVTADPVPPSQARRMLRRAAVVAAAGASSLAAAASSSTVSGVGSDGQHPMIRRLHALADVMEHADGRMSTATTTLPQAVRGTSRLLASGSAPATVPVITGISPRRGSTAGGTRVTITGTNFPASNALGTSVWIGGRFRCKLESSTQTEIVCITADPKKSVFGKGSTELPVCVGLSRSECRKLVRAIAKQETKAAAADEAAEETLLLGAATSGSVADAESVEVNIVGFGNAVPSTGAVTFQYIDTWSARTTWGGLAPPIEGDSVVIPPGRKVLLDVSPPRLFTLVVQGTLEFADDADLSLDAHLIIVNGGVFQVGTEAKPFVHKATITLHGHPKQLGIPIYGTKVLAVRYGTLDLHGTRTQVQWTRLGLTAAAGSNSIYLEKAVDWKAGQTIAVAATGFKPSEAETATILSVSSDKRTVFLTQPLRHEHLGETISFSRAGVRSQDGSPIESAPMRAEVSLLSRNVVVQGDEAYSGGWVQFGAHIMLHSPGDESVVGRIEDVEMRRMGQAFRLGRYAMHFHVIGRVRKSYVRRNAIWRSFNRGVTIHGVYNFKVTDNVLHDIMGHAIFIEDAIETDNVIERNCITRVRSSFALLNTDMQPAGIWITNPDQYVRDNAVSGSDGHGFWFKSETEVTGVMAANGMGDGVCPQHSPLGAFERNTAHSNSRMGLWLWEHFLPRRSPCDASSKPKTAVFKQFTGWRNGMFGIAITQVSHIIFDRNVIMENGNAGFELVPAQGGFLGGAWGDNRISRSVIAGNVHSSLTGSRRFGVIAAADHGMLFDQVSFVGFTGSAAALHGCSKCAAFSPRGGGWESRFRRIAWLDSSPNRVHWRWKHEGVYVDLDGTLTAPAPSRAVTSTTEVLRSGRKDTIIPVNQLLTAQGLKEKCGAVSGFVGTGLAAAVCDRVQWRRMAINGHLPSSNAYKSIIFTIEDTPSQANNQTAVRHADVVAWDDKRKTRPNGYVATLPADLGRDIELGWQTLPDQSDRVDIETYGLDLSSSLSNELITIKHDYMSAPNRFEMNGIEEASESTTLKKGDKFGTWAWDDVARTISYAMTYSKPASGKRHFASATFRSHRCPKGGCVTVPACDLAGRQGKTRGTTWLRWSDDTTWETLGWSVGTRPRHGDNVTIPWEFNVVLDVDSPILETLIIAGRLRFGTTAERTAAAGSAPLTTTPLLLTAMRIIVRHEGRLSAGSRGSPYDGLATIRMIGDRFGDADGLGTTIMPPATITSMGQLWLVGNTVAERARLMESASAATNSIVVHGTAQGWAVGDSIVVATSSFEPAETETRVIKAINRAADNLKTTIELTTPLQFDHTTEIQSFPGHADMDTSPYVSCLTRSVKVIGYDLTEDEIKSVSDNVVADNEALAASGVPERRRASPLQTVRATELDQYGCRIHVTREAKDECVDYEGGAMLHSVEMHRCGHGSQFAQGISGEALLISKLGTRQAPPHTSSVEVRNIAMHWLYHGGINIGSTTGAYVTQSVIHRPVGSGVLVASPGAVVKDNLVTWVVFPGTHNGLDLFEDITMPAGFEMISAASDSTVMHGNAVAGSERAAFKARLPACGAAAPAAEGATSSTPADPLWRDNEGTATGYGVWSWLESPRTCVEVRGFTIARAWEFGILVVSASGSSHAIDNRILGANVGSLMNTFRPGAKSHSYQAKRALYRRNLFVGTPSTGSCSAGADVRPVKRWRHSVGVSASTPRVGVMQSTFFSGAPHPLEMSPPWSSGGYGAIGGASTVEDTMFAQFNDHSTACKRVDRAVSTNGATAQVTHPMSFSNIRWYDVDSSSRLLVHTPPDGQINHEDCVQSHCQGLKSLIYHDLDGSFLYGRDESVAAPTPGQPIPGTGTVPFTTKPTNRRFTILGNSGYTTPAAWGDILPIPLRFRANGSVVEESHMARRRGVAMTPSDCEVRTDWANTAQAAPAVCAHTGSRYRMLVLESMDPDTETRNLGPVAFLGTGPSGVSHPDDITEGLGREGNHESSALQLVNSQMDITWASGWTGLRRLSTFWAPVATPYHYTVYFQGTNPQSLRFRLLDGEATEGIVVSLWYANPQKLAVYVGGQRRYDINWGSDDVYDGAGNAAYVDKMPTPTSPTGTNAYFRLQRTLHFTVRGNQPIDIRTLPVVQVSLTMAVSVEAFFDEQDAFVDRLAFVLNIPQNRIRIVNIVPGSTKVDFEIEPDQALLQAPADGSGTTPDDDDAATPAAPVQGLVATEAAFESLQEMQAVITNLAVNGSLQNALNVSIEAMTVVPPPEVPATPPPPPTNAQEDEAYRAFLDEQGGSVTTPADLARIQQQAVDAAASPESRSDAVSLGRGAFSLPSAWTVSTEAGGADLIRVLRESGTFGSAPVTVDFAISPATQQHIDAARTAAGPSAAAGAVAGPATDSDITSTSSTLSFGRGESSASAALPTVADSVYEFPPPAVRVTLSNAQGGATLGRVTEGIVVLAQPASQQAWATMDTTTSVTMVDISNGLNGSTSCVQPRSDGTMRITFTRQLSAGVTPANPATAILALTNTGPISVLPGRDFINDLIRVDFAAGEQTAVVDIPIVAATSTAPETVVSGNGTSAMPMLSLRLGPVGATSVHSQAVLGWLNMNASASASWTFCSSPYVDVEELPARAPAGTSIAMLVGIGVGVAVSVVVIGGAIFAVRRYFSPPGRSARLNKGAVTPKKQLQSSQAKSPLDGITSRSGATTDATRGISSSDMVPSRLPTLSSAGLGTGFAGVSPLKARGQHVMPLGIVGRVASGKSGKADRRSSELLQADAMALKLRQADAQSGADRRSSRRQIGQVRVGTASSK